MFRFQDVTADVGLEDNDFWGTGATFVDLDNDGDLDIYACGYRQSNRVYINERRQGDGSWRFTEQSERYGLGFNGASMTMAFADIDNDGDLDGYLATTALAPPPGTRFQVRDVGGRPVVADEIQEYWQLIHLPGGRVTRAEAGQFDHLFRNDGARFTEVTKQAGIKGPHFTLSATWWDYNDDGFPDLYAANDFMGPDCLYHNNGDGTFTDVAKDMLPHTPWFSMGTDIADVNNDGRVDFLATDMDSRTHHREMMMRGNLASSNWFLEFGEPRQYARKRAVHQHRRGPDDRGGLPGKRGEHRLDVGSAAGRFRQRRPGRSVRHEWRRARHDGCRLDSTRRFAIRAQLARVGTLLGRAADAKGSERGAQKPRRFEV